jgi:hypothetical protein
MRPYLIGALLIIGAFYMNTQKPRGIRNNNPLNIRIGNNWQGETSAGLESEFEVFQSPEYGIRAAARLLRNYRDIYGLNTIRGIINRWAPPNENNTTAYIASMVQKVGAGADTPLNDRQMRLLLEAMIMHENGMQPYSASVIDAGFNMGYV